MEEPMTRGEKSHMAKDIVSGKDTKPSKLHSINIEPAENGFTVETRHEKSGKGKEHEMFNQDVSKKVFNNHKDALAHCSDCMETHAKAFGLPKSTDEIDK